MSFRRLFLGPCPHYGRKPLMQVQINFSFDPSTVTLESPIVCTTGVQELARISHMESVERGHLPLGTAAATVGRPSI